MKPFVKRGKTDAADAEAISEAVTRKTMRFVPIKSAEQQASVMVFRARALLVRQRTQAINALRAHMPTTASLSFALWPLTRGLTGPPYLMREQKRASPRSAPF